MAVIDWSTASAYQPSGCEAALVDFGQLLRPSLGGKVQKVDRPGSRWRLKFTVPIQSASDALAVASDLISAKRQGIKIDVPLMGISQGSPGSPLVNGANPSGTSLPLKTMTAGYVLKKGYWLTLVDAGGDYYLHKVMADATVSGGGTVTATIEPPIRQPFADGATVLIATPRVQGWITDEVGWAMVPGELVGGYSFTVEEAG